MQFKKMGPQPVTACTGNLQNGPEPIVAYVCLIYLEMAPWPNIACVGLMALHTAIFLLHRGL